MRSPVETRPLATEDIPELRGLFESSRTTRHCWCMAFCVTRRQFAAGWVRGGNMRRFTDMSRQSPVPMGVLASAAGAPVGWCACGPRSRYVVATGSRGSVLTHRDPAEDSSVWLLPCIFVRDGFRRRGVTSALVRAAVEMAAGYGARAVESWPLAAAVGRSADSFVGREPLFEELGFRCVDRPTADRVIMRLELSRP